MITVRDEKDMFIAEFERFERDTGDGGAAWLLPIRKAALARFNELGLPTTRDEEWRFTNVAPIAHGSFRPAPAESSRVTREVVERLTYADAGCTRLVFVNGRLVPRLSSGPAAPAGLTVGSLAAAMRSGAKLVQDHLTRHAAYQQQPFTALNTALMEDGAYIAVAPGAVAERPIHLVFVADAAGEQTAAHPRNLVVAGENSQLTLIEHYVGLDGGVAFNNVVTEIVAGPNAVVDHYRLVREAESALHVSTLQLELDRSANVSSHTITLGGALVRNDINADLDGEGAECTMNGLYMVDGERHVDNHLRVEHIKPHCDSREFFKGILDGHGRGVFSGRIFVHEGAQKTDAKQTNMSLLLSREAQVESKPQLEIFADDVKCTHGATIGQVDEDAVFYLRSRGITEEAAKSLLVLAFARESLARVRCEPLRRHLESLVVSRLPHGEVLLEAV